MEKTVIIKKIAVVLITLLVIAYIVFAVMKSNFTQIKTEKANIMTVSETIPAKAYFIRDEHLIKYSGSGFISYVVNDGDKVSNGEPVANVFSSADSANNKKRIDELESQIANLQQLNKTASTISATPDELDKSIDSSLSEINSALTKKELTALDGNIDDLLYIVNERQVVTGKMKNFDEKISQLRKEADELKKSFSETQKLQSVNSGATGYFVSFADGYEGIYETKDLDTLMPGALSDEKISKKDIPDNVIGKTVEGVTWYIACELSGEEALRIKNSDHLSVDIPSANNRNIDVKLYSINQKTKTSDAVVILSGDFMNPEMSGIRKEDISIVLNTYTGTYVSKNAVHEEQIKEVTTDKNGKEKEEIKTVKGVYIQIGSELLFKQIVPLYTGDDFVVCKSNPNEDELTTTEVGVLKPYDNVVVEGANLYDGKIIDHNN